MAEPVPSIRRRLSNKLILISLVWGLAVAVVVSLVVDHEIDEVMDATLRESAQILQPLLSANTRQLPFGSGQSLPAAPHEEEVVWQIVDLQQGVVLRSHAAPAQAMTDVSRRDIVTAANGWRVLVTEFDAPGCLLMVAQVGRERREAKLVVTRYTVGGALLIGIFCAAWLRASVRRELRPLALLTQAVTSFDPLQPGASLAEVDRQELGPVRDAIATLGARLATRVAHERTFAAHAAHALRTPLAGMMAQLATAQRAAPEQVPPMLALARQAAERLRRVVSAILTLFRSGSEVTWRRVDLAVLLPQLQVDGVTVRVVSPASLWADSDLLAAALANLLDNAARYGARHVEIALRTEGDRFCMTLSDDGPGIAENMRLLLQDRLDNESYASPVGMGLMLADLVARAHGGALRLPPSADGCTVELLIGPAASALAARPTGSAPDLP